MGLILSMDSGLVRRINVHRPPPRQRNLLHDHPLLKKGGVHGKSHKAVRRLRKIKDLEEVDKLES